LTWLVVRVEGIFASFKTEYHGRPPAPPPLPPTNLIFLLRSFLFAAVPTDPLDFATTLLHFHISKGRLSLPPPKVDIVFSPPRDPEVSNRFPQNPLCSSSPLLGEKRNPLQPSRVPGMSFQEASSPLFFFPLAHPLLIHLPTSIAPSFSPLLHFLPLLLYPPFRSTLSSLTPLPPLPFTHLIIVLIYPLRPQVFPTPLVSLLLSSPSPSLPAPFLSSRLLLSTLQPPRPVTPHPSFPLAPPLPQFILPLDFPSFHFCLRTSPLPPILPNPLSILALTFSVPPLLSS